MEWIKINKADRIPTEPFIATDGKEYVLSTCRRFIGCSSSLQTNDLTHYILLSDIKFPNQPERSKRENSQINDDSGRIKKICMRKKCHQPLWVREYDECSYKKPLFCAPCWEFLYAQRDLLAHSRSISAYDAIMQIQDELIPSLIDSSDKCEMRCSEHCGNTVREAK